MPEATLSPAGRLDLHTRPVPAVTTTAPAVAAPRSPVVPANPDPGMPRAAPPRLSGVDISADPNAGLPAPTLARALTSPTSPSLTPLPPETDPPRLRTKVGAAPTSMPAPPSLTDMAPLPDPGAAPPPPSPLPGLEGERVARLAPQVAGALAHPLVRSPGGIETALSPPELGRVAIRLHAVGGQMRLTLAVDRPETLDLMRRHIDALDGALRALGLDGCTLALTDRAGTDARPAPPNFDTGARPNGPNVASGDTGAQTGADTGAQSHAHSDGQARSPDPHAPAGPRALGETDPGGPPPSGARGSARLDLRL